MLATDHTVRIRTADLPVKPLPNNDVDAKTTRVRRAEPSTKMLPKAVSGFDGKTVDSARSICRSSARSPRRCGSVMPI